ncbi:hypothetical protein HSB1_23470 [Halogranum salarium B-1]|uniref:Uncharacterized protein n=1 Tax=Halogranum salarium B-1 TaxID=1210908 RepID=J3JF54_9EURY|nr:hypothetical protein HSB1_23470 [Halogranum salarium B-1]
MRQDRRTESVSPVRSTDSERCDRAGSSHRSPSQSQYDVEVTSVPLAS